jgi:tetratricopeptide (TPR) repeat protein
MRALVIALLVLATPAEAQVDVPQVEVPLEARERQARALALIDAGNPRAALAELERVYELLADHPRRYVVLSNIGRCHQALGNYERALDHYRRYLDEGGAEAEDRAAVEAAIRSLDALLGTIVIAVDVPRAEVWIGERRVGSAPGIVRVPGGAHAIELRAPGHASARRELWVAAGATVSIRVELEELGTTGPDPAFFWAGLGLTAATAVAWIAVSSAFFVVHDENASALASMDDRERYSVGPAEIANEQALAVAADALLAVAAALGIATTVLGIATPFEVRAGPRGATLAWSSRF